MNKLQNNLGQNHFKSLIIVLPQIVLLSLALIINIYFSFTSIIHKGEFYVHRDEGIR